MCPKRRISHISQGAEEVSPWLHEQVKLSKPRECVCCKGLRFRDRPKKRVALAEIAADHNRPSIRKTSSWGCKECGINLCNNNLCFDLYHLI